MRGVVQNSKTSIVLLFIGLFIGFIVTGPLQLAYAQQGGQPIPPPPRVEADPIDRDIAALGIKSSVNAPNASSVSYNTLSVGDNVIHGLVYYNNFLYASTRTSPARILKIDPVTLAVVDRASIPNDLNNAEDVIQANGYIWSIVSSSTPSGLANLVRVDPVSMAAIFTPLQLPSSDFLAYGEALNYSFNKLWAGGYNKVAEIDVSVNPPTFVIHDFSAVINNDYILSTSLTNDQTNVYVMFLQGINSPPSFSGSTLLRLNPANPTSGYLRQDLAHIFPDDMKFTNGNLFTSLEDVGQPSYAYRFPPALTPYTVSPSPMANMESYGVFQNPLDIQKLWGAYVGSPGILTQFDMNLNQVLSLTMPTGYNNPAEIAFDGSGNMYIATFQSPAGIVRYTIPDPVTITISKSGTNVVLNWTNIDPLVDHYEVWRSSNPYFTPADGGSLKLADVSATVGAMSYTNTGVLGDIVNNYFYVVRAVNDFGLISPISNRVGKIERELRETVSTDFNWIALPLNANLSMASHLATYIQNNSLGVVTVATIEQWNPIGQNYQTFIPPSTGDFSLQVGGVYRVTVDISTGSSVVWPLLGNVPNIGATSYTLRETASTDLNWIMLPLDLSSVNTASALKIHIDANANPQTTVFTIENWNVIGQNYQTYSPPTGDYSVRIGYPYRISIDIASGNVSNWP